MGLDVSYLRGEGSRLYYEDGGSEIPVWDFLGGYGSTFFGHNHPALAGAIVEFLQRAGVVHGQGSVRSTSERLCATLSERLRAAIGRSYHVVLANTGAEAVEIAARHAELAYAQKRSAAARWVSDTQEPDAAPIWTPAAREALGRLGISEGCEATAELREHNRRVLAAAPMLIAVERSFHGMTARALDLTHDADGRFGGQPGPSRVMFVAPDSAGLRDALLALTRSLVRVRRRLNAWDLESMNWTSVFGFFMEPIQGEGGIHPVSSALAAAWRDACAACDVPLIADEIQSGMGRTGSFIYCEQVHVRPDYVLLGKSLGGGLSKISAVAIARELYLQGFSMQHCSTFAEDDFSSHVALQALELLDAEAALAKAATTGERLFQELRALAERHPTVIGDVRGRGLMLGLEWRALPFDRSNALRLLQHYGWLGYALSGYLLRAHGVRVAPTLSRGATLRLEPPYDVPDEAVRRLLSALEELCTLLECQDAGGILGPCVGIHLSRAEEGAPPLTVRRHPVASHVAFIGHFIEPDGVALWDPTFSRIGTDGCRCFLDRIHPLSEPLVYHRDHVHSATGGSTTLSFIGLPFSSEQCYGALRSPERAALRELVQRAVELAGDEGCTVVGLGGFCSILTRNGKELRPNGIAVTTGNGYTVGAGLLAMKTMAREQGIAWPRAHAAVIGATGNIGAVLARLLASEVASLVLVGRASRTAELEAAAGQLLYSLVTHEPDAPIARALADSGFGCIVSPELEEPAALYRRVKCVLGDDSPIDVGADPSRCRGVQLIASASNQPNAIVFPEHLGEGPIVICDLSVPGDVHESVARDRPHARVVRGGVVRAPGNPDWYVPGIPLQPGEMFACMAETALMGLEGHRSHGSFGTLTPERVLQTMGMARKHGFTAVRGKIESSY
ncbi:MAG: aminotransferase class III-fold pyridoxal phosphate-dependent enzyme [Gemmatimonadaceae bacterium]